MINESKSTTNNVSTWVPLLRIAGYCLWIILAFVVVQIFVYVYSPPPKDVLGFFNLYQKNAFLGLLSLDLIMLADWVLEIPVFLALYILLRRKNESYILLATVLAMVGIAIYFASGIAFEMLILSSRYAQAVTEIQKTALLSAGETLLATYQGTAFNVSYVLVAVAFLIDSVVMLKSEIFSKNTAYVGIAMGILMLVPPTVGQVGFAMSFLSLIPMIIWFVMVARKLFQIK